MEIKFSEPDVTNKVDWTKYDKRHKEDARVAGIAKICHEANRAYCQTLGDHSIVEWENAPDWQRQSSMAGVKAVLSGAVTSPEQSHLSWLEVKKFEGWKYGPEKRPGNKEHPCMVPYDQLPDDQKRKDSLFFGIVSAFTNLPNLIGSEDK